MNWFLEWLDNVKSILEMDMEGNDYCDSEFCDYDGIDSDDLDEKKAFRGQNREKGYVKIESKGENIIVDYEKIWKVEYYGLPKIILKEVPIFGRKRQTNGK